MMPRPDSRLVSIVVANYNGAACLEGCLRSLLNQTYQPVEIVVVDNASTDNSVDLIRQITPRAVLLRLTENTGFAGGVNAGVEVSRGDWIAILNNDTEAAPNWLSECMAAADRHPDAGFLACRILEYRERGRVYSAGDCFLRAGIGYRRGQDLPDGADYREETEIFAACGCAALYRREVIQDAGGFDRRFFAYLEDVDLGLRLQAGGCRGYYAPKAEIYHLGGVTSGGEFSPLSVRLRTRNSLLLLIKSLPLPMMLRCAPMIIASQLAWLGRAVDRGRTWNYLTGLAGVVPLMPAMVAERAKLRLIWKKDTARLWQAILASESMARRDFASLQDRGTSTFLRWYFRVF